MTVTVVSNDFLDPKSSRRQLEYISRNLHVIHQLFLGVSSCFSHSPGVGLRFMQQQPPSRLIPKFRFRVMNYALVVSKSCLETIELFAYYTSVRVVGPDTSYYLKCYQRLHEVIQRSDGQLQRRYTKRKTSDCDKDMGMVIIHIPSGKSPHTERIGVAILCTVKDDEELVR